MKKIAIISYFHSESSLCLAKAIADQGVIVDCFVVVDMFHDKGIVPGIDYHKASKLPGVIKLNDRTAQELYKYSGQSPVTYYLFRLVSYSSRLMLFNHMVFRYVINRIRRNHYDAINIVGQWPWIEIIHNLLKGENVIHTFHEVGNHFVGNLSTSLIRKVIKDKSKVILPSMATLKRFQSIEGSEQCMSTYIPFGKFETLLLYRKHMFLQISINSSLPTFLFYGYIKPYKGLGLLADACRILENKKCAFNLIIAGAGEDINLKYFESLKNATVINRFLTDDEMMYLNSVSDVVLLPYKSASQSGIVPTSFMFGNPIIATKVGALTEVIKDGVNGLMIEPENSIAFASAIQLLIDDREMLASLKKGAANFGHHDEYDWSIIAQKTILFFKH